MKYSGVVVSALCYALSFFVPQLWWVGYVGIVLIFLLRFSTFSAGYLWGLVAFGVHTLFIVPTFYVFCGPVGFLVWLGVVAYCAIYAGIWVYVCRFILRPWYFSLVTTLFFAYMGQASLWVWGVREGYGCFNPLLAFFTGTGWLAGVRWWGMWGSLFLLIWCFTLFIPYVLAKRRMVLGAMVLFLLSFVKKETSLSPELSVVISKLAFVRPAFEPLHPVVLSAQELLIAAADCLHKHPDCRYIVTPESVCEALDESPAVRQALADCMHNRILLVGSYIKSDEGVRNACYCFCEGVVQVYTKQHLFPGVERGVFRTGVSQASEISISDSDLCLYPHICSELFFKPTLYAQHEGVLVCLINDGWFVQQMAALLFRWACFQAAVWGKPCIYASYYTAAVIDANGSYCKF